MTLIIDYSIAAVTFIVTIKSMGRPILFTLLLIGSLSGPMKMEASPEASSEDPIQDIKILEDRIRSHADHIANCCVSLKSTGGALGSGVLISKSGLILSAAHLFAEGEDDLVVITGKGESRHAKVIQIDRSLDVALIQLLGTSPKDSEVAQISARQSFKPGTAFIAAGHASGFSPLHAAPIRVGFGFEHPDDGMILTTCKVTAGDSGGPLFDARGELCGIHLTVDADGRYSSHVPLSKVIAAWPQLARLL